MNKVFAALALLALGGCAIFRPTVGEGEPVPRWALMATDGGDSVRSTHLGGRPGMLIWIDPLCPQVENASQSGGPLRALESRWNATDSAWVYYVAARSYKDAVLRPNMWRPWLKEMKLRGSVLLDTSMDLAHKLGVRTVPTAVVIDAQGNLRWKGPVHALERENVVVASSAIVDTPTLATLPTDTLAKLQRASDPLPSDSLASDSLATDSLDTPPALAPAPPPLPPQLPPRPPLAPYASRVLDSVLAGRPVRVPSLKDSGCPVQETLW